MLESDHTDPSGGAPDTGHGLSRRTVLRAGAGAVWAAPVITLVTAAPAMASSPTVKITNFQAVYQGSGDPLARRPDILIVTAGLENNGAEAVALTHRLSVPGNLFAEMSFLDGTIYADATGSLETGWQLDFPVGQVDSGSSVAFSAVLQLGSRTEAPFHGYQAPSFSLVGSLIPTTGAPDHKIAPVAHLAASWLLPNQPATADIDPEIITQSAQVSLMLSANDVAVWGPTGSQTTSTIGQMFLAVIIPQAGWPPGLAPSFPPAQLDDRWLPDGMDVVDQDDPDFPNSWVCHFKTVAGSFSGVPSVENPVGPQRFGAVLDLGSGGAAPDPFELTWVITASDLVPRQFITQWPPPPPTEG